MASAVASLGSVQVRNRATLIGNICRASPSADTPPPLIADGAAVTIWSPEGERRLPLERFFVSPGKTVLGRGEIVTEVRSLIRDHPSLAVLIGIAVLAAAYLVFRLMRAPDEAMAKEMRNDTK